MSDKKDEQKPEAEDWKVPAEIVKFFHKYQKFVNELKDKYTTLLQIMSQFDNIDLVITPRQLAVMIITIDAKTEVIDRLTDMISDLEEKKSKMEEDITAEYIPIAIETILRECNYDEGTEDDDTIKEDKKEDKKEDPNKKA